MIDEERGSRYTEYDMAELYSCVTVELLKRQNPMTNSCIEVGRSSERGSLRAQETETFSFSPSLVLFWGEESRTKYRYYDPASTKWLSRDPKGESGGINLYAFCENDPVNKWDYLGLDSYLFIQDGFHMALAVERHGATGGKKWRVYGFQAKGNASMPRDATTLEKVAEGVDGEATTYTATEAEFRNMVRASTASWRLRTNPRQDSAMEREILRQASEGGVKNSPDYKFTPDQWPVSADSGVCVQRAVDIVNKHTGIGLPKMWLESAFVAAPHFKSDYPLQKAMQDAADVVNRKPGVPYAKAGDKEILFMQREWPSKRYWEKQYGLPPALYDMALFNYMQKALTSGDVTSIKAAYLRSRSDDNLKKLLKGKMDYLEAIGR